MNCGVSIQTVYSTWILSYFLMVHVLDQEVGPKGTQEHKLK